MIQNFVIRNPVIGDPVIGNSTRTIHRIALVIMAKFPEPGAVKTRLCPPLSPEQAADLASALLLDTVDLARRAGHAYDMAHGLAVHGPGAATIVPATVTVIVATAPDGRADGFAALFRTHGLMPPRFIDQGPGGLSDRLIALADRLFGGVDDPMDAVFFMQADGPCLPVDSLVAALAAIEAADLVIGPALDGGYWTIGLKAPTPALFTEMVWSTDTVFAQTMARARSLGLSPYLAPLGGDIDDPADLAQLARDLADMPETAPRSHAVLLRNGMIRGRDGAT